MTSLELAENGLINMLSLPPLSANNSFLVNVSFGDLPCVFIVNQAGPQCQVFERLLKLAEWNEKGSDNNYPRVI